MFGTVERQEIPGASPVNIPITLAGPSDGFVSKVEYNCNIDYEVTLTNGGIGTGHVGVSTCCPITYNPACCVGVDEEGNDIIQGVLKVDCIIAKDLQGADCACFVNKQIFNDNISLPIALWSTADDRNPYFPMGESGGYQISYNPISGYFNSPFANHCCGVETIKLDVGCTSLTQNNLNITNDNFNINVCSWVFKFCNDGTFESQNVRTYKLTATDIYKDDTRLMNLNNDCICVYRDIISDSDISADYLYINDICGNNNLRVLANNTICINQCNSDACSWVRLTNGCVNIYGCSCVCIGSEGVVTIKCPQFEDDVRICNGRLYVECGIHTGYDILFYCDGLESDCCLSGYIYCDASFCLCGGRIKDCIYKPSCNIHTTWNTSCCLPNEHEIRCYLYNRCAATAYSSGTTLFIRTQANAGWC